MRIIASYTVSNLKEWTLALPKDGTIHGMIGKRLIVEGEGELELHTFYTFQGDSLIDSEKMNYCGSFIDYGCPHIHHVYMDKK